MKPFQLFPGPLAQIVQAGRIERWVTFYQYRLEQILESGHLHLPGFAGNFIQKLDMRVAYAGMGLLFIAQPNVAQRLFCFEEAPDLDNRLAFRIFY